METAFCEPVKSRFWELIVLQKKTILEARTRIWNYFLAYNSMILRMTCEALRMLLTTRNS